MSAPAQPRLHLASRSPRRRDLLEQIGVAHVTIAVEIDERPRPGEAPRAYVARVATDKALAARATLGPGALVLAADTAVVLDDQILGKPDDEVHAAAMLARLSGRAHDVLTGVALAGDACHSRVSMSRVWLRATTAAERAAYAATGEPLDKAGGYAIQGRAAIFVERLEGSYSGVMGLPLFETAALLAEVGVRPP